MFASCCVFEVALRFQFSNALHFSCAHCLLSPSMIAMNLADEEVDVADMVRNDGKVSLVAFGFR